ncbi:MAG: hypothetical protein H6672_07750 [Anaerolineaceae bacterium]|nr:hypothetical protein [Anaerolineaceae bacterium]
MRKIGLVVLLLGVLLLAACQLVPATGDSSTDPEAVQQFLPTIPGYTATEATNVTEALSQAGVGASLIGGNLPLAGMIAKLDNMIQCYRDVGAISARIYTETNPTLDFPKVGAIAVINETRLGRNLVACALNTASDGQIGVQSVQPEPCGGSGSIEVNGEKISYVYGATVPELCVAFQQPFRR